MSAEESVVVCRSRGFHQRRGWLVSLRMAVLVASVSGVYPSQLPVGFQTSPHEVCPEGCVCVTFTGLLVDCNNLQTFPAEFPQGTEMVNIEHSSLGDIPSSAFQELHSLRFVSIHNSRILTIRSCAFSALTGMDSISIYESNIGTIEKGAFSHIENTRSLEIYSCNITNINEYSFVGLMNISTFSLYDNNISYIRSRAFSYIDKLETMSLFSSKINTIASYAFSNIKNINDFSLAMSNISRIQSNAFFNISNIRLFSVHGSYVKKFKRYALNRMSDINAIMMYEMYMETFECGNMDVFMDTLQGATFHTNQLRCDCSILWLVQMLDALPPLVGAYLNRCFSPDNTTESAFETLTQSDICTSKTTAACASVNEGVDDLPEVCGFVAGGSMPTTPEWYYTDGTTAASSNDNENMGGHKGSSPRLYVPAICTLLCIFTQIVS